MDRSVSRSEISTAEIAEAERFEFWREMLRAHVGIVATPDRETDGRFVGGMTTLRAGGLQRQVFEMDGHLVQRGPRDVARQQWQGYWVHREAGAGTHVDLGGGVETVTQPGDLLIIDADVPLQAAPVRRWGQHLWLLPKHLLDPFLPKLAGPLVAKLSGQSGVNALAASYLEALAREIDRLEAPVRDLATEHLCRLIGIACGAVAGEQPESVRQGRLTQARRYIDQHLAEPELSPATVAAALGIAVRTLHLLFEPTGTSFFRYVQQRRLEEARRALLDYPARPVIDIAFAWGFSSLSGFYRAFHTAYGASPGDVREQARRRG